MRVLQLIDSLEAGGAERMAVNLANALSDSVERSYLCATRQEGLLKASLYPTVGYLFLDKKRSFDIGAILRLYRFVKTEEIGIVHAHSTSFFLATLVRLIFPRLKIVWHDHYGNSSFLNQRPKKVLRWASRYFSHIYSVNDDLVHWSRQYLKTTSVSYLPNFVVRNSNEVPVTVLQGVAGKRILCLANLRAQKDHLTLLKAFKLVQQQYPDWSLHCVGKDFCDAYSERLYSLIKELKLNDSVFLYGSCTDTASIIDQCDIGVLSSQSEGLPLALLEYGFGGLAVVATDVGDCHKVIIDDKLGQLVLPMHHEHLSQALIRYIRDENYMYETGDAFGLHVKTLFSQTATIHSILDMYKTL